MDQVNLPPKSASFQKLITCGCCFGKGETHHLFTFVKYKPSNKDYEQVYYKRYCSNAHSHKRDTALQEMRTSVENWNFFVGKNKATTIETFVTV